jgi:hypothetical protein
VTIFGFFERGIVTAPRLRWPVVSDSRSWGNQAGAHSRFRAVVIGSDGLLGILGALLLFAWSDGLWSILLGAFGAMLPDPLHTIHAHFPHEPLRTLQRFHRWVHTDKSIKEDIIVGVGSQIALVAVMIGLTMVAHYGVLDPALAK